MVTLSKIMATLERLERSVTQLFDRLTKMDQTLDGLLARDKAEVDGLNAQVTELKAKAAAGTLSAEESALLDKIQDKIDVKDATNPAVQTDPVVGQVVTPTPAV